MIILAELSGEHTELPRAEAIASAESSTSGISILGNGIRTVSLSIPSKKVKEFSHRLALSHTVNRILVSSRSYNNLLASVPLLHYPNGSFAVRAAVYKPMKKTCLQIQKEVGTAIPPGNKVDLASPENEFRVVNDGKFHLCQKLYNIPRKEYDKRIPQHRPFFSPVSLHPRLARTVVNLARAKRGHILLDPFCGTGGILMEAGLCGIKLVGSDIQQKMVDGTRINLAHIGLHAKLNCFDIGEIASIKPKVDAIATDPPYGRAATTRKEPLRALYNRAFEAMSLVLKKGKRLSIVLPSEDAVNLGKEHFRLEEEYCMKVHRSLTRHFCVYRSN